MEKHAKECRNRYNGRLVIFLLIFIIVCLICAGCNKIDTHGVLTGSFVLKTESEILNESNNRLHNNPLAYLFFLPGIIFLVIILICVKKKIIKLPLLIVCLLLCSASTISDKITDKTGLVRLISGGLTEYNNSNYDKALEYFIAASSTIPRSSGIHYNIALTYYKAGKTGQAVFHLKKAIHINSADIVLQKCLSSLEGELGLNHQVKSNPFIHDDIPFILLIIFFNLSLTGLGLVLIFKKGGIVILFVLLVVSLSVISGFLATNYLHANQPIAVVADESILVKKIPLDTAQDWIEIQNGTIVKFLGEANNYILIQTGQGIKGWIKKTGMIY